MKIGPDTKLSELHRIVREAPKIDRSEAMVRSVMQSMRAEGIMVTEEQARESWARIMPRDV